MRLSVSYEEFWRSISIILQMVRKPNSIILLLFIQNNSQFKNIAKTSLPASMLSLSSIVYVQVCPAPQIFSKQQMSPFELSSCCSCHVFSYYFAQFERTKFHIIRKTHQILRRQCCCFMNTLISSSGFNIRKKTIVTSVTICHAIAYVPESQWFLALCYRQRFNFPRIYVTSIKSSFFLTLLLKFHLIGDKGSMVNNFFNPQRNSGISFRSLLMSWLFSNFLKQ